MGVSTMVLFGGEWPTVAVWRFGREAGGEKCKGKEEGGRRLGGDIHKGKRAGRRRKGIEERMAVYSKYHAAMKPP